MALSRAKAFQEKQAEAADKSVEKLFQVKILKPGDAGNDICTILRLYYKYLHKKFHGSEFPEV
jgi:hypothetical protein